MNDQLCTKKSSACVYALGIAGTFLVMAAMVWVMRTYTQTPSLAEVRGAERIKNLSDFHALNSPLISDYDWQDKSKEIVRVPVSRAKELVLDEWQNPGAGRAKLMARATNAFAPAAAPKNPYE